MEDDLAITVVAGEELWVFGNCTTEFRQWFTKPGCYESPWQAFLWRVGLRRDEPPLQVWEYSEFSEG